MDDKIVSGFFRFNFFRNLEQCFLWSLLITRGFNCVETKILENDSISLLRGEIMRGRRVRGQSEN